MPPLLRPPVEPMLATLARDLPAGDWCYEPKWDGFRCLAFVEEEGVVLCSRRQRPLQRYFPEVVEALAGAAGPGLVLDGELVVAGDDGLDFSALLLRLHPSASRVARLRAESPATFVAFDLLGDGGRDLRSAPLTERRAALEARVAAAAPSLVVTPATDDRDVAEVWLDHFTGGGIDGVVAKEWGSSYESGRRSRSWVKVKPQRTADCVVAGVRLVPGEAQVASLLLGLYDAAGALRHAGVSASFRAAQRRQLLDDVRPFVTSLDGHPWEGGFALERGPIGRLSGAGGSWDPATMVLDWVPLRPRLVCEVEYDQVEPGGRWRHPVRWLRWRADREPRSCTTGQLALAPPPRSVVDLVRRP